MIITIAIAAIGFELLSASTTTARAAECIVTPTRDMLPGVIAPMAGSHPIWFIDTTGAVWQGPDAPVKSVWVLATPSPGELRVTSRRLDGPGVARFRVGTTGHITDTLVIKDPIAESMIPGGASADVLKKFAFVSAYLLYPSPGCWEVTSEWGDARRSVTVLLK